MASHIIKRRGHRPTEEYSHNKLHSSITAACLSARSAEGHAVHIASVVCSGVSDWLENKAEVTSDDIRRQATALLAVHHPEAAYLYQHHNAII